MKKQDILKALPYSEPFLFVDELLEVSEERIKGTYVFNKDAEYYKGHFVNHPVTPGVLLTECMAQIGVVSLGIFLINSTSSKAKKIALTQTNIDFLKPVLPGEKVTVYGEKVYFRFNKLKCKVQLRNQQGELAATGVISGMAFE